MSRQRSHREQRSVYTIKHVTDDQTNLPLTTQSVKLTRKPEADVRWVEQHRKSLKTKETV